jgi:hypothetical protein
LPQAPLHGPHQIPALEALGMGAVRTGGTLRINGQCMTARGIALADGCGGRLSFPRGDSLAAGAALAEPGG